MKRTCSTCWQRPAKNHRGKPVCDRCSTGSERSKATAGEARIPLALLELRGDEMTPAEVASRLGITRQGVTWLERRALVRFRLHWALMFGPAPEGDGKATGQSESTLQVG